jgi:putative transposase
VGPIAGTWLPVETKQAILIMIALSQAQGVSARRSCAILAISHRRVVRWQAHDRAGLDLADRTPGPPEALHRLLPVEIEAIATLAVCDEYVDLSHRILAITAGEKGLFFASFSTVYRVLKARDLMTARGPGGRHNGRSLMPVRKTLSAPNQRWCWDISYLRTLEKGVYLYLYLLLDEFSRKALHWRIAWTQTATEARLLLEGGLERENILDLPEDQRPELLNDRGRQMKAKPIRQLCEDHGMPQLFARPRTPNDNPFIESAFSSAKRAPDYPGQFLDDCHAMDYFEQYFDWYNHRHYHSGIDYVTPQQAHAGQRAQIVARRLREHLAARLRRRVANQRQSLHPQYPNLNPSTALLVV